MRVPTRDGPVELDLDSRQASIVAEHANAMQHYLYTGDETPLRSLRRTHIQVSGRRFDLPVDPVVLDRLAAGGELHYELYRR